MGKFIILLHLRFLNLTIEIFRLHGDPLENDTAKSQRVTEYKESFYTAEVSGKPEKYLFINWRENLKI